MYEDFPITYWKDGDARVPDYRKNYEYHFDARIDKLMMDTSIEKDGLVKDIPNESLEDDRKFEEEHLPLLNRVSASVIKNRKFGVILFL